MIDSETRLCCLIGHPVRHSVSPQMHNAAFKALDLNYIYLAFDVEEGLLADAVKGLKAIGARGFNVTIPHKILVMRFLDELDETAEKTGAVNVVVNDEGVLRGYNTDVHGIERALREAGLTGVDAAIVFGAGGAARAAVTALLDLEARKLIIANRTLARAEELARWIKEAGCISEACGLREGRGKARECEVIVNATPLGMYPRIDEAVLDSGDIPGGAVVLDLVYNPPRTRLLEEAERAGAKPVSGVDVLVYQGAYAFRLWTGVDPPIELMRRAAVEALEAMKR